MEENGGWVGHVQLVSGDAGRIADVRADIERTGIKTTGNPDVYIRAYKQFGIEEARELRERAYMRPIAGERRFFIIASSRFLFEAQNALLKTLEEPSSRAVFFFITPSPETLLPTFRSRSQMYEPRPERSGEMLLDAKRFLASNPAKRIELLKPFLERDEEGDRDLGAVISFLASLEHSIRGRPGLDAVYRARKYIGDRGALVKPLLEQVALLVPVSAK